MRYAARVDAKVDAMIASTLGGSYENMGRFLEKDKC